MKNLILCLSAAMFLFTVSCSDHSRNEQNHPYFANAQRLNTEGKYEESVQYFEKYLRVYPESAKAHYELAAVYDEGLNMPVDAIYHYKQYLKFAPDTQDREYVKDAITGAEKKLYVQIRKKLLAAASGNNDLPAAKVPQSVQSPPSKKEEPAPRVETRKEEPAKKYPEFYTVEKGDTLAKISQKVYGTGKYYKAIYDANREALVSTTSLKIGQKLRIPPVN